MGDLFGATGVRFFVEGDMQKQSKRYLDFYNLVQLDAYTIGNVKITLSRTLLQTTIVALQ